MKEIKVLGSGCDKCTQMAEHAETAARQAGIEYKLEKVTSISAMIKYGVVTTPGLVVDGQLKVSGRVPTVDEIKRLLI